MFASTPRRVLIVASLITFATVATSCDEAQTGTPTTSALGPRVPSATPALTAPPCAPPYPSGPPNMETVFCADPGAMSLVRVTRIVDGDTFHVDLGGRDETIRIFGIDTPERGQPCFGAATDALRALASAEVRLRPSVRERDRSGRLLRYVYTPDGLSIDAALVAAGLAVAWRQDGELRDALVALEDRAHQSGTGCIWLQ